MNTEVNQVTVAGGVIALSCGEQSAVVDEDASDKAVLTTTNDTHSSV